VNDEITLTLPRQRPFVRIAHLVLGGLAVRLDLTFENLEDLQIALAGLLARPAGDGFVTLSVRVEDGALHASVGPFDETLRAEFEREPEEEVGLRRVLETVVDDVELGTRDGGVWVELRKTVQAVED
jgi:anti-sigma regulatory factor (Ser/Thr protein kinase)